MGSLTLPGPHGGARLRIRYALGAFLGERLFLMKRSGQVFWVGLCRTSAAEVDLSSGPSHTLSRGTQRGSHEGNAQTAATPGGT